MRVNKKAEEKIDELRTKIAPDDIYMFSFFAIKSLVEILDHLYCYNTPQLLDIVKNEDINAFSKIAYGLFSDLEIEDIYDEDD